MALQVLGSSQQLGAGYNLSSVFTYLMKTRNVDLSPFQKSPGQLSYEQAVGAWQNAAAQVAELAKTVSMKIEGVTLEQLNGLVQKLLPPQPVPQQFGYDPNEENREGGTSPSGSGPQNRGMTAAPNTDSETGPGE